jgi:hypothetical protein
MARRDNKDCPDRKESRQCDRAFVEFEVVENSELFVWVCRECGRMGVAKKEEKFVSWDEFDAIMNKFRYY